MRILFISNYYFPFSRGGYGQLCQEVAVELADRGHQVCVLTSCSPNGTDGTDIPDDNGVSVYRLLHLEVEAGLVHTIIRLLKDRKKLEEENLNQLRKLVANFQPDQVLIWGMWNVPRSVPALVEQLLPGRVAYYLCDYWLSLPNAYIQRWQASSKRKLTQLPKQLLSKLFVYRLENEPPINLSLEHPICVSRAVRELLVEAGIPIAHAQVIHVGTQVEQFVAAAKNGQKKKTNGSKLLYMGRLVADKGLHTIIEALNLIVGQPAVSVTLDIFGKGDPDYEAELKAMVAQNQLGQVISFRGSVPYSELPRVLAQYDALIFPSEWQEPFARIVLEAMAAGLVVIGTTTGGTGEILVEGKTGLTFPAGDAKVLANQIRRLSSNPSLKRQLAKTSQQCMLENFTFSQMVDRIETKIKGMFSI
jgi:glycosyltransferase involved in cell wall biosynthesis